MIQKKGLGRGLESLLGIYGTDEIEKKEEFKQSGIIEISLALLDPNPKQPRKTFAQESLIELANSIKINGVIQPIVVTKNNDRYMIVAGERRWRASKIAGVDTIPAIVRDFNERQIKEITIIENLQREDLNPIEMAHAISELMTQYNMTQEVVAERIGKSRSVVANVLRLLTLPIDVIILIESGRLSVGHAKVIVSVLDANMQIKLANMARDNKMTVRDLEEAVKIINEPVRTNKEKLTQSLELREFISDMRRVFATKVSLSGNEQKGKISIEYYNKDDLQRIYELVEKLK
ncbi:MAG: ParB/RepB/Spo0J family partition protein [Clostridia bacterium]|jgi:ParB family chromosome partitioning protein|nr:ParB/RepB/Spo0J family partition protein [Clostridia bacterium]MDD4275369.1 ParB/RepB/Spo0J family partition protein [Clostridia bacterium]